MTRIFFDTTEPCHNTNGEQGQRRLIQPECYYATYALETYAEYLVIEAFDWHGEISTRIRIPKDIYRVLLGEPPVAD